MADYNDKVVKQLAPGEMEQIKKWRKKFIQPFDEGEVTTLLRCSQTIEKLWRKHVEQQQNIRERTNDVVPVFGQEETMKQTAWTTTQEKDKILRQEILSENVRNSSPYRRLKLVMDYWCALWFWPIEKAHLLPTRDEFLMDLSLIIEGDVYEPQAQAGSQLMMFAETAPKEEQLRLVDEFGFVDVSKLCREVPRLKLVAELGQQFLFLHWELEFGDLFASRGGFNLVAGNPPWTRVRLEPKEILGEFDARIGVKNYSAAEISRHMQQLFQQKEEVAKHFKKEACALLSCRNVFSSRFYRLSGATNPNLYKCFIERGHELLGRKSNLALLHDPGVYIEPDGSQFRIWMSKYLVFCARFINQLNHFPEEALGHAGEFSITVLNKEYRAPHFKCISSVFHPRTIDESFSTDSSKPIPKLKDSRGWVLDGHPKRIICYDKSLLDKISKNLAYPNDSLGAPLLSIYATPIFDLLAKK